MMTKAPPGHRMHLWSPHPGMAEKLAVGTRAGMTVLLTNVITQDLAISVAEPQPTFTVGLAVHLDVRGTQARRSKGSLNCAGRLKKRALEINNPP